mmetsp:Transcript_9723/g.21317  ORF Transcript_9723/g.21317 Transcript_9723/m.21317 type:complete len:230 (-) Transcript_9723:177-866(-)
MVLSVRRARDAQDGGGQGVQWPAYRHPRRHLPLPLVVCLAACQAARAAPLLLRGAAEPRQARVSLLAGDLRQVVLCRRAGHVRPRRLDQPADPPLAPRRRGARAVLARSPLSQQPARAGIGDAERERHGSHVLVLCGGDPLAAHRRGCRLCGGARALARGQGAPVRRGRRGRGRIWRRDAPAVARQMASPRAARTCELHLARRRIQSAYSETSDERCDDESPLIPRRRL